LQILNHKEDLLATKAFPVPKPKQRDIAAKEIVDEVIFTSKSLQDRLMLELQSRCRARIGEVLAIRVRDIEGGEDHGSRTQERKKLRGHLYA
jgi:hypothetical protein